MYFNLLKTQKVQFSSFTLLLKCFEVSLKKCNHFLSPKEIWCSKYKMLQKWRDMNPYCWPLLFFLCFLHCCLLCVVPYFLSVCDQGKDRWLCKISFTVSFTEFLWYPFDSSVFCVSALRQLYHEDSWAVDIHLYLGTHSSQSSWVLGQNIAVCLSRYVDRIIIMK